MKKLDIRPIIKAAKETVTNHEIKEVSGAYRRWLWQDEENSRKLGINEYGCADAANILYTINDFCCDEETRSARISALLSLQNEETGMFNEETHHTIHTTAHCAAALQLFDIKPRYPLSYLHKFMEKSMLYDFLDNEVDWNSPWDQSHKGAGIYAALVCSDEITEDFQKNYFDWFFENTDEVTGFWKKGYAEKAPLTSERYPNGRSAPGSLFSYMAGGFHYLFNHEYAKMPLRYPDKVIDSCIEIYEKQALPKKFGKQLNFIEADWVYCLNRASRQTAHRRDEVIKLLSEFAEKYINYLLSVDYKTHDEFNDLHMLFGGLCALAELQAALPGMIVSEKPLRLVLDRRPFI